MVLTIGIRAELGCCCRHREWRKIAKKMRRKRIRSALAKLRDDAIQKGLFLQYHIYRFIVILSYYIVNLLSYD
jgi:hypothetical protein